MKRLEKARIKPFNLETFCSKNRYSTMKGIKYENGYQIATNYHILGVLKESYPYNCEDKIIDPETGKEIQGTYPNYMAIRPTHITRDSYSEIELSTLDIKQLKAEYKAARASKNFNNYQIKIKGVPFAIKQFILFYPIIKRINGAVYLSDSHLYTENDCGEWAIMYYDLKRDNCFIFKWE